MFVLTLVVIGILAAVLVAVARPAPRLAVVGGGSSTVRAELVGRFVERSQRYRRTGAIVGLVLACAAMMVRAPTVQVGSGVDIDLAAVASIGLAGSIAGSILAEAFRLRRPSGPRTASLEVRDRADYRDQAADRRERVVVVLAAVGLVVSIIVGVEWVRSLLLGAGVAGLVAIRHWTIGRIALRPRPVLSPELADADDEVRLLAASAGVSRPIVTLSALLVASQWFAISEATTEANGAMPIGAVAAGLMGFALLVVAFAWWWSNRSFGLTTSDATEGVRARSHLWIYVLAGLGVVMAMSTLVFVARSLLVLTVGS